MSFFTILFTFSLSDSQHTHTNMNTLTNHRIFHQFHAIFSLISVISNHSLNNFRPISNLNFISKILEKVVASRIQSHLSSNSLSSSFQSAYRIFHSTETTLLKIHNDLILAMDRGGSLHSFFSTYLLPLILSIIPSFLLV